MKVFGLHIVSIMLLANNALALSSEADSLLKLLVERYKNTEQYAFSAGARVYSTSSNEELDPGLNFRCIKRSGHLAFKYEDGRTLIYEGRFRLSVNSDVRSVWVANASSVPEQNPLYEGAPLLLLTTGELDSCFRVIDSGMLVRKLKKGERYSRIEYQLDSKTGLLKKVSQYLNPSYSADGKEWVLEFIYTPIQLTSKLISDLSISNYFSGFFPEWQLKQQYTDFDLIDYTK